MDGWFIIGVVAAWVLTGAVLAVVMRRRGHDLLAWFALGGVLGPLAIPLAVERLREHRRPDVAHAAVGDCDLLVGVDGSEESVTALREALALFGDRVTSVTVATVLDHDSRDPVVGDAAREAAGRILAGTIDEVGLTGARTEILYGRADEVLTAYAEDAGIDVIVVGARGRGASRALFGSIAGRIVGASHVPVFVGRRAIR
jgi:nucleotide-binding universal stress UspA family protein